MYHVPFKVVELIVGDPPVGKRYQVVYDNSKHVQPCGEDMFKLYQAYKETVKINQDLILTISQQKKSKEISDKDLTTTN